MIWVLKVMKMFWMNFKKKISFETIKFVSKWYNESIIPKKKVQSLINDINLMNESYMKILKNEVILNLKKCSCVSDSILNISSMFDAVNNQFNNLKSEHKRFNILEEMGVFIRPNENPIGNILVDEVKDNR